MNLSTCAPPCGTSVPSGGGGVQPARARLHENWCKHQRRGVRYELTVTDRLALLAGHIHSVGATIGLLRSTAKDELGEGDTRRRESGGGRTWKCLRDLRPRRPSPIKLALESKRVLANPCPFPRKVVLEDGVHDNPDDVAQLATRDERFERARLVNAILLQNTAAPTLCLRLIRECVDNGPSARKPC